MGKITYTAAAAVGYVLGSRAGRERYEQIAAAARRVRRNPRVQRASSQAQHKAAQTVREATPVVTEAVKDKVAGAARNLRGGSDSADEPTTVGGPVSAPVSTSGVTPPVAPDQPATTPPGSPAAASVAAEEDPIGGPA